MRQTLADMTDDEQLAAVGRAINAAIMALPPGTSFFLIPFTATGPLKGKCRRVSPITKPEAAAALGAALSKYAAAHIAPAETAEPGGDPRT